MAYADPATDYAACVTDCNNKGDDNTACVNVCVVNYQAATGGTTSGTVVGPQGTVQDRGVVVPPTQNQTGTNVTLINPLKGGTLESFLNNILDFIIRIGTIIVILMVVYVGYLFVVAQGNSTKIEEARKALLWTVVGALVLLGSKAIAIAIKATVQALSVGG